MHNGTHYHVGAPVLLRQHLVRFYFLIARVPLPGGCPGGAAVQRAPPGSGHHEPCLWDITRHGEDFWPSYRREPGETVRRSARCCPEAVPPGVEHGHARGDKITSRFVPPEVQFAASSVKINVIGLDFYSSAEAQSTASMCWTCTSTSAATQGSTCRRTECTGTSAHTATSPSPAGPTGRCLGAELPQRDPVDKWITDGPGRGRPGRRLERQPPGLWRSAGLPSAQTCLPGRQALLPTPSPPTPCFRSCPHNAIPSLYTR